MVDSRGGGVFLFVESLHLVELAGWLAGWLADNGRPSGWLACVAGVLA